MSGTTVIEKPRGAAGTMASACRENAGDSESPAKSRAEGPEFQAPLERWFDQVWVISLRRRPDRLARFWAEMEKADWPFQRPEVFDAVDGDKVGMPKLLMG